MTTDGDTRSPVLTVTQAGALIQGTRYHEAISLITQALAREPDNAELNYLLGTAYYRSGNSDAAPSGSW